MLCRIPVHFHRNNHRFQKLLIQGYNCPGIKSGHFYPVSTATTKDYALQPLFAHHPFSTTTPRPTMKIYTKTGDKGSSALYNGERRPKNDPVFEALGAVDEVSSQLGMAHEHGFIERDGMDQRHQEWMDQIVQIQCVLQDLGSHLATPRTSDRSSSSKLSATEFDPAHAIRLEGWIDHMDQTLPTLTTFILPSGGGLASCALHIARATCRRAERRVFEVVGEGAAAQAAGQYMNRLSDYLFTAARYAAYKEGKKEKIYRKE